MARVLIRNLNKKYDEVHAVKGVNLEIRDREFVVLVGPSGCGKTTTLRMVAGPQAGMNAHRSTKVREDADWRETISIHPVVRTHPETGRKLLFVNRSYTVGFEGWAEAESKPLLDYLLEHGHRPEFTCRFRWANGSIAFWDNRCTKHLAVHDAGPFRRIMRRTQICGDRVY